MRWHGNTIGMGFLPLAAPTAKGTSATDAFSLFAVAPRLAVGDVGERQPRRFLEVGPDQVEGKVELGSVAGEVLGELGRCSGEDRMGRSDGGIPGLLGLVFPQDLAKPFVTRDEREHTDRRVELGLEGVGHHVSCRQGSPKQRAPTSDVRRRGIAIALLAEPISPWRARQARLAACVSRSSTRPRSPPDPARATLRNSIDLAGRTEALGYHRYWVAEHHNTRGLAGSAPEILVGHIAQATETLRVGTGGVMLPHYSPLKVAESFKVLSALHPGRIDLGLGRAPGSDQVTAVALSQTRSRLRPSTIRRWWPSSTGGSAMHCPRKAPSTVG